MEHKVPSIRRHPGVLIPKTALDPIRQQGTGGLTVAHLPHQNISQKVGSLRVRGSGSGGWPGWSSTGLESQGYSRPAYRYVLLLDQTLGVTSHLPCFKP